MNDMYETYSDAYLDYQYPQAFDPKKVGALDINEKPFDSWEYGDSHIINFNVEPTIKISEGDKIRIYFYNFRHELLNIEPEELNASYSFSYFIDEEKSKKYFYNGIYYVSVMLVHNELVKTIFHDCLLHVK